MTKIFEGLLQVVEDQKRGFKIAKRNKNNQEGLNERVAGFDNCMFDVANMLEEQGLLTDQEWDILEMKISEVYMELANLEEVNR